jgi:hypothetical protein
MERDRHAGLLPKVAGRVAIAPGLGPPVIAFVPVVVKKWLIPEARRVLTSAVPNAVPR